jgi:hypothetical protein
VQTGTGKAAEGREHHPIAAGEQQQDRQPHPGKEFLEGAPHQPQALRRLERAERRAQADIDREHAADPDDGAECVKGEGEGGYEEGSRFEALQRLHAGLCEPWQAAAQSAGSPHHMAAHSTYRRLCVPKIRFCNIGDEGRRGQAVM